VRRRLLALAITLTAAVLAALVAPLVAAHAEERAITIHERRLAAATRFATLADSVGDASSLGPDLMRYGEVTESTRTWIVDIDGSVLAPAGSDLPADVPGLAGAVRDALAGTPTSAPTALWPWQTEPLIVATPIGRDAQILGAVVMLEDTSAARDNVQRAMVLAAAGGAVVLALVAWLVGVPLVGWVVRPVDDLTTRVEQLSRGRTPTEGRHVGPPELRRLAESFDDMAANVEHSRQQQRELVADVSHQLANPLTALRLRLENLAVDDPAVEPVLAETERLARSLDAVIEISRAGGFDRRSSEVDVARQLRERVALWAPLFGDLLTVRVDVDTAPAFLEEDLVPTVLDVLLDNALKYAEGRSVDVALEQAGDAWRVTVRDHGDGVSAAEAAELGRRFHRLDRHAGVEGTGLGLAIVVLRIRDADGYVVFDPADPGLRTVISLPARLDRGTTAAPPDAAGPAG
jgi:signal transduction histidine kinase